MCKLRGGNMIKFAILGIVNFYVLWALYVMVMNMKRAKDNGTLTKLALFLGYPWLFIGIVLDVIFNWVFGTILFLEFPKSGVFTSRLKRHRFKDDWRGKVATFICIQLLDTFDPNPNGHCGQKK